MSALQGLNHDRQGDLALNAAQNDFGGEELLPGALQTEDGQRSDGWQRQREHDAEKGGHMAAAVYLDRVLQLLGQGCHVAPQEEGVAADSPADI